MPFANPFSNPAFSATSVTEAINLLPNRYGRLNELNLSPVAGSPTTSVMIYEKNGILRLLPTKERGSPGTVSERAKRKARTFNIPHIPHDDHVSPNDIQNLLAFNTGAQLETMSQFVNDRLAEMKSKHDQTLEYHRMGALKGIVYDADGSTVLHNFFTEFGITTVTSYTSPAANRGKTLTIDFKLGTDTTKVVEKCLAVKRHIEDNLAGEQMTEIRVLVSNEFFDKLITHPNVEKAYANWAAAQERIGGDLRKGFTFGGITFEEYRATTDDPDGSPIRYIAESEGHAFPLGTMQTFKTYAGPADFNETVNKLGRLYYAKIEEAKFGRGYDIHTQSNPLAVCMRPGVLVKVHTSN